MHNGSIQAAGTLSLQVIPKITQVPSKRLSFQEILQYGLPHQDLSKEVYEWRKKNIPNLWRGLWKIWVAQKLGISHMYGQVSLAVIKANGQQIDYGLASLRVVTTAGVGYITDAFQNTVELEDMKYHGIGTGNTAEAVGDTDIETELTTQYSSDNTRATGTQTENGANVYQTVGTNTVDAAVAIVEHGILSNATVGSGVLLDRSVFSVINLGNGDSLQTTYDFTSTAGG